ncbi:hypothetical protein H0E87_021171 [Populus deltoides]|uniref:Uncharacterized protein n=1 Tax=Populus deltoides TaxID=3696 RepID=A0A8T2XPB4_POPDE|nr:hypothetical protein H0E87_021171 [Populus deltoides]
MGQGEKQEFSSPLPVLPRLDRLDRLLQFLEGKHSLSGRHTAKSVVRTVEAEDQCKNLSSALEEVQHKGTLMDRLEMLENRVLQLSLEMDVENTSRSSSSTFQGPEKMGRDEVSTIITKEDEQMIITNQEKQDSLTDQEITCTAEACVRISKASQKDKRSKKKRRAWLGWLAMGC